MRHKFHIRNLMNEIYHTLNDIENSFIKVSLNPEKHKITITCDKSSNETWLSHVDLKFYVQRGSLNCLFFDSHRNPKHRSIDTIFNCTKEKIIEYISKEYDKVRFFTAKVKYLDAIAKPFKDVLTWNIYAKRLTLNFEVNKQNFDIYVLYTDNNSGDYLNVRDSTWENINQKIYLSEPNADKLAQEAVLTCAKASMVKFNLFRQFEKSFPNIDTYIPIVSKSEDYKTYMEIEKQCLMKLNMNEESEQ